ncbi:unnamed protein product [Rotaria sp. Silwood2]|nr:unnamed protein product [Rotaria sp. Silwood2]CAF4074265.1 unnamed protein product [Rotaria sp. Silwood2]
MSNDYALFIIILPNDFDKEMSSIPTISSVVQSATSIPSIETRSRSITSDSISYLTSLDINSKVEKDNEHSQETLIKSLCIALTNYFAEKNNIDATWMLSDNKKTYQITFYVEFGIVTDCILQDLIKFGIGTRNHTKVFVLPTTFILGGQFNDKNESVSALSLTETITTNELLSNNSKNKINGTTLSRKIRKRINESNFKKSVRARLMVHQVVASIRASTVLSFDFVLLICLASMLAALGLLENSTVIIVASMLVSPLMNPILGFVFGLSVREHSLWRRGLRNELIGLVICISCGFILGLLTTFAETKWGASTSFPTPEMKSRGDIKRLWVGVLIALPSGAGVALSVLGGNIGSLVGVAISASLLPPAVNSGLLFAYALLGISFSNIAAVHSSSLNNSKKEYYSNLNCKKYINNDYQPLYTCNLAREAAALAGCSLLLTIVNIICIIIMALLILRIKEVVPLHQPNKDIVNFFHYDVKAARDYNKTIHEEDLETDNLATLTIQQSHLAQSIVNRWKAFKSITSHDNQQNQEIQQSSSINNDLELNNTKNNNILNIDTESRRKLFRLKTFAIEYDLDVFDKNDYDLLNSNSREKVRLLINDLIDIYQDIPTVFVDLFCLQSCNIQTSTDKEHVSFYQEIIEILPPKWYQLFIREQERRRMMSWSSLLNQPYSLRVPQITAFNKPTSESNISSKSERQKLRVRFRRRSSVPEISSHVSEINQDTEIPVEGTRFSITKLLTTT